MRILLVGEYSRLHNSLKAGLVQLGHEVLLVSDGDGFKQYPSDHSYAARWCARRLPNYLRQVLFRLSGYDLARLERAIRFRKLLPLLKGYDVVQLINEAPVKTDPAAELRLLKRLIGQNKKTFLLCCGIDYTVVKYMKSGTARYTLLDEYNADATLKPHFRYILDYESAGHKKIHDYLKKTVAGVIASDLDYLLPLKDNPKFLGLIPNPVIPPDAIALPRQAAGPVVIFLGINRWNRYQKGIRYFEEALQVIKEKYPDKVNVVVTENIPYPDYMRILGEADVVLDQVYAYDQGYNALEAMALGKVVFTGAEREFMAFYGLEERVAVNAVPDTAELVKELSALIENPAERAAIAARAKEFVIKEHHYRDIAQRYALTWTK